MRVPTRAKQRLAVGILAALVTWPGIHFALYRIHGIDPWKLCGWAMYARPRTSHQFLLMDLLGDRVGPVASISASAREELARVSARTGALGRLQSPDTLGAILLQERQHADGIRIIARSTGFDCTSGTIRDLRDTTYDYWR